MNSYQSNTSAPSVSASQGSWGDFPEVEAHFLEKSSNQKAIGVASTIFSALSGGGAVYSAVALTATPFVVMGSFAGLGVVALTSALAGYHFLRRPPSENDPTVCRERALAAGRDIEEHDLGYRVIMAKYGNMIAQKRINIDLLKRRFSSEAYAFDYQLFKFKHGLKDDIEGILELLLPEAQEELRKKYLEDLSQQGCEAGGILAVHRSREATAHNVSFEEVADRLADIEGFTAQDYRDFTQRNARDAIIHIKDHRALARLGALFLQGLTSHIDEDYGGVLAADETFALEKSAFGELLLKEVKTHIFGAERKKFLNDRMDYKAFRQRNGLTALTSSLQDNDPAYLAKLQARFKEMPYEVMTSEGYAPDRKLLNIDEQSITEQHIDQMNDLAAKMNYLGKDGFKASYGTELLERNWLLHHNKERYQKEVAEYLLQASLVEWSKLQRDSELLELNEGELLKQRWETMPFLSIAREEKAAFLSHVKDLFTKETLVNKLSQETVSILEIVEGFQELFFQKLFLPTDLVGTHTLSSRLESDIASITSLEELFSHGGDVIIRCKLLSEEEDPMRALIVNFMIEHALELLTELGASQQILSALNESNSLPSHTIKPLAIGQEALREEKRRHSEACNAIQVHFSADVEKARCRHDTTVAEAIAHAAISERQKTVALAKDNKKRAEQELNRISNCLSIYQQNRQDKEQHLTKLKQQQAEIEREKPAMLELKSQLPWREENYKAHELLLKSQKDDAEVLKLEEIESQVAAQQAILTHLQREMQKASDKFKTIKDDVDKLEKQRTKQKESLQSLQNKLKKIEEAAGRLDELEKEFNEESGQVTGLKGVIDYYKKSGDRNECEKLKKEAKEAPALKRQILAAESTLSELDKQCKEKKDEGERAFRNMTKAKEALCTFQTQFDELERQRLKLQKARDEAALIRFRRRDQLKRAYEEAKEAEQRLQALPDPKWLAKKIKKAQMELDTVAVAIKQEEARVVTQATECHQATLALQAASAALKTSEATLASDKRTAQTLWQAANDRALSMRDVEMQQEAALHQEKIGALLSSFKKQLLRPHED